MHVCHICDSSLEGDYFRNIAVGMTRHGARLSLIELGEGKAPTWLPEIPGVGFHSLGALRKIDYPFAVRRLARLLEKENVDILHTHLFYSGLIGVLSKRFRRKTVVALMRHHTGVVRMLGTRFHIAADKWMAEKADHVLTVSNAAQKYMLDVDNIERDDIEVVHLGFDFEKFSPNANERVRVREEFDFTDDDFVIGYVANFARGKGHAQIIVAFQHIMTEIPNARLFFVGRGELDEVKAAAARFPAEKIVFGGWRSDIAGCLNAMDIFVQPSLSEAFSQVIIEAMGVGLPVVATDVGGASEVIESGVNGLLIAPYDPASISHQVVRLYRDDERRRRIAEMGRSTVTANFTAELMVERQFQLYRSWIEGEM